MSPRAPMTKTEAAARRRCVVDLVNAISNLERDDLHHVLTKNNTTREWLENDLKKINRIVADHHPDEFAEARSRIWETVLLGILDMAGAELSGSHRKEPGDVRTLEVRPSFGPRLWSRREPPSTE